MPRKKLRSLRGPAPGEDETSLSWSHRQTGAASLEAKTEENTNANKRGAQSSFVRLQELRAEEKVRDSVPSPSPASRRVSWADPVVRRSEHEISMDEFEIIGPAMSIPPNNEKDMRFPREGPRSTQAHIERIPIDTPWLVNGLARFTDRSLAVYLVIPYADLWFGYPTINEKRLLRNALGFLVPEIYLFTQSEQTLWYLVGVPGDGNLSGLRSALEDYSPRLRETGVRKVRGGIMPGKPEWKATQEELPEGGVAVTAAGSTMSAAEAMLRDLEEVDESEEDNDIEDEETEDEDMEDVDPWAGEDDGDYDDEGE